MTSTPSTDPALTLLFASDPSPVERDLIQVLRALPDDEQRPLMATFEALADDEGAPDAIVAGFQEELAELRAKRVA